MIFLSSHVLLIKGKDYSQEPGKSPNVIEFVGRKSEASSGMEGITHSRLFAKD